MWRIVLLLCCVAEGLAQPAFERIYGKSKAEAFHALLSASDGSIVAVGYTASTDPVFGDGWVVKLTAAGDTVWTRTFGQAYVEEANAVLEIPAGYVVAGVHVPASPATYDMYLACYDPGGALLWQQFHGGSGSEGVLDALVNQKGRLVFCGYSTSFTNGGNDMYVIETDQQGNLIRSANIGGPGNEQALGIWQAANSDYVLIGYSNSTDPMYNMLVARLDSAFNLLWTKEFGGSKEDLGFDVTEDGNGNLWLLGFHHLAPDSLLLTLIRTDGQGEYAQWHYPAAAGDFGYRMVRRSNGVAVAGVTQTISRSAQMMLLAVDANGMTEWKSAFGGSGSDVAFCLTETADGQLLLGGTTEGFGQIQVDAYLVRCDSQGQTPCPDQVSFVASAAQLCEDENVFFTNTTVSSQPFFWYLNGQVAVQQDHWGTYFPHPGSFTVGLSACSAFLEVPLTVWAKPPAYFTYSQVGDSIYFFLGSGITYSSLKWNFGDNSPEVFNDPAPVHVFPGSGPFWVTLSVTSPEGCDSTYVAAVLLSADSQPVSWASGILLHPNPAEGCFMLSGLPAHATAVSLRRLTGEVVQRWQPVPALMHTSGVSAGPYLIEVQLAGGISQWLPLIVR
ncbi:MAG: hypothetical protein RMK52_02630 [Chitinophagales bacterium]|nr:hypothetical protein [Chitinophagales bacterium]MDW8393118.1 hypothetical protein [Chitinophagales bacterium]